MSLPALQVELPLFASDIFVAMLEVLYVLTKYIYNKIIVSTQHGWVKLSVSTASGDWLQVKIIVSQYQMGEF